MYTKDFITKKVIETAVAHFRVPEGTIDENTHFLDDIGADSLDAAELVMMFEEQYDIPRAETDEFDRLLTVKSCVEYIQEKIRMKECKEESSLQVPE